MQDWDLLKKLLACCRTTQEPESDVLTPVASWGAAEAEQVSTRKDENEKKAVTFDDVTFDEGSTDVRPARSEAFVRKDTEELIAEKNLPKTVKQQIKQDVSEGQATDWILRHHEAGGSTEHLKRYIKVTRLKQELRTAATLSSKNSSEGTASRAMTASGTASRAMTASGTASRAMTASGPASGAMTASETESRAVAASGSQPTILEIPTKECSNSSSSDASVKSIELGRLGRKAEADNQLLPLRTMRHSLPGGAGAKIAQAFYKQSWTKHITPLVCQRRHDLLRTLSYVHPDAPLTVIPFDVFCSHGSLPRSSDRLAVLRSTLPEHSMIVFISHRWLRPWHTKAECEQNGHVWAGAAHPDDDTGTKFKLIVQGIKKLERKKNYDVTKVMIWLDYACIDQDVHELKIAGIKSLLGYIHACDFMLIPSPEVPKFKQVHRIPLYGDRAWTRLEAFGFYIQHLLNYHNTDKYIYYSSSGESVKHVDYVSLPYLYPKAGEIFDKNDIVYVAEMESILLDVLHYTALGRITSAYGPAMIAAAGAGDVGRLKELTEIGISVDAQDANGVTALWSAARMGQISAVTSLIALKADLNPTATSGYAPLHCAAHEGHSEIWHLLMDSGADVNLESKAGVRARDVARKRGHFEKLSTRSI